MSAAVVRVKDTTRALAISVDGNGRFCYLDPYRGAMLAVAEAARNVACAGGEPIGATNNLNFGNPERPEIMWQFAEAVRGIGDACRALGDSDHRRQRQPLQRNRRPRDLPDAGSRRRRAARGRVEDRDAHVQDARRAVVLLGDNRGELGGSEYLATMHDLVRGRPPALDLEREAALQELIVKLDPRRLRSNRRTIARKAAWPSRWPNARSTAAASASAPMSPRWPAMTRRRSRVNRDAVRRVRVAHRGFGRRAISSTR